MREFTSTGERRWLWKGRFRARSYLLLFGLCLWLLVILFRFFQIMVIDRDDLLRRYQATSWRQGTLPALRGRVIDRNGVPLSWSTRHFVLSYHVADDISVVRRDLEAAAQVADLPLDPMLDLVGRVEAEKVRLATDLAPGQVHAIASLRNPRLDIDTTFRRNRAALDASLLRSLGQTRVFGQVEVGISGWEQEFDRRLRGQDGKYQVMVDKAGLWIPETFTQIAPPRPGYDVQAPTALR